MASGILFAVVFSVTAAITAGQQHSREAQQRIAGSLAAEELLGRLITLDYDDLPAWNNYAEAPGEMVDAGGELMPLSMNIIGRQVTVTTQLQDVAALDVRIRGRVVRVRANAPGGRMVADLSHFVPEPSS